MSTRNRFLAAGASLAVLPLIGAGPSPVHLAVSTSAIDSASGLVAAQHEGYFTEAALDVAVTVSNGAAGAAAVAGGSMQIASSNLITLIKAHLNGLPFTLIAPSTIYDTAKPTQVLVVRSGAGINKAADLDGKTISVTAIGDLLASATLAWIGENGGTPSSVRVIELPPSSAAAALQAARVQAAALAEPFLSQALATGQVQVFAKVFDTIGTRFLQGAYFTTTEYVASNPDVTARFVHALLRGNRFANDHPDRTLPWMIDFAMLNPAVERRARRERFGDALDVAQVQTVIDALVRLKVIDRGFDAHELVNPIAAKVRA